MKIAIDARSLLDEKMTGIGFYTLNLIKELAALSPEDEFILFISGSVDTLSRLPKFTAPNIKIAAVNLPNRILSLLLLLPIGLKMEHFLPEKVDYFIFPNHHIIKTNVPYALTVHDLSFIIYPKFFTLKSRLLHALSQSYKLATKAEVILAVSNSTKEDLIKHWKIAPNKIIVTPLGINTSVFLKREQPSDKGFRAVYDLNIPYFLSLATKEPRKNLPSVIEAYNIYRACGGQKYPLVLIGADGWKMKKLGQMIKQSPFSDDIKILDYIPEKHKPALVRGAKAFIFPSFYEGFGLPVLEAMASGVPVITSATSSLPEITNNAAILINPFNVNDISSALKALFDEADSQSLRESLIQKGIIQAQKFSWNKTAKLTRDCYLKN